MARQHVHLPVDPTSTPASSSSSSSPERFAGDEADCYMSNPDDSHSSIAELTGFRNMTVSPVEKMGLLRKSAAAPVNRLPPELLIAIFSKITSLVDLRSCMLVSRQWANCSVELLWHKPHFGEFKKYEAMVAAIQDPRACYKYSHLIKRLNLSPIAKEANDGSMKPLGLCTKLERLTLNNCVHLTDSPLMDILASNPRIQALDMSQLQNITDISIGVVAQTCSRLQGLIIAGCKRVTDASMVPLSQNCKLLRRVSCGASSALAFASC
jgi:F-box and leucine-rich repeat protein GRR1